VETERLVLRRWTDSDAAGLYKHAKDPGVGPIAGWPVHTSAEDSLSVIRGAFGMPETFAICLKGNGRLIGAIGLRLNGNTDMTSRNDEFELGYWLGKPFWGQGIVPEVAREILRRAFENLGKRCVWAGYYEGNAKSSSVLEKCGFRYQWTTDEINVPLMHEVRRGRVSKLTREDRLSGWSAFSRRSHAEA